MKCPTCKKEYPYKTEQAVCIERYGECINCHKSELYMPDVKLIMRLARERGAYGT